MWQKLRRTAFQSSFRVRPLEIGDIVKVDQQRARKERKLVLRTKGFTVIHRFDVLFEIFPWKNSWRYSLIRAVSSNRTLVKIKKEKKNNRERYWKYVIILVRIHSNSLTLRPKIMYIYLRVKTWRHSRGSFILMQFHPIMLPRSFKSTSTNLRWGFSSRTYLW